MHHLTPMLVKYTVEENGITDEKFIVLNIDFITEKLYMVDGTELNPRPSDNRVLFDLCNDMVKIIQEKKKQNFIPPQVQELVDNLPKKLLKAKGNHA